MTAKEALAMAQEYNKRKPGLELQDALNKIQAAAQYGGLQTTYYCKYEETVKALSSQGFVLKKLSANEADYSISWNL